MRFADERAAMKRILITLLLAFSLGAGLCGAQEAELFFKGVEAFRARDFASAATWFERAAEQGDGDAQFLLGRMHYDGNSLTVDVVTAYQWFAIAAVSGVVVAPRYRDGLARDMTEEQVADGQRRADEWLARFPPAAPR